MKKIFIAIVAVFAFMPLTLVAQTSIDHYWENGLEYRRYSIMHEKVSDIRIDYLINTPGAANFKCKWGLYSINPDGSSSTQVASETTTKQHDLYINHNFRSGSYWFYVQESGRTDKLGLRYESFDAETCSDTQISVAPSALIESNAGTLSVYYTTRTITLDDSSSAYCTILQKSKVSDSRQIRTVNVYVDGVFVGRQRGPHYFPVRGDIKASDLSVSIKNPSKYFLDNNKGGGTGIVASGTNYDVYLVQHFTVQANTSNLNVSGTNPQTVNYGYQNTSISFTPLSGYMITGVTVNGVKVSGWTKDSYTYPSTTITENKIINVTTGPLRYKLTVSVTGLTGNDCALLDVYKQGESTPVNRIYLNASNPSQVIAGLDLAKYTVKQTSWSWGYTASSVSVDVSLEAGDATASFVCTPRTGNLPLHGESSKIAWGK